MKTYKKLATIRRKITEAKQRPDLIITHIIDDDSVQAEQRLDCLTVINLSVDRIKYPKDMQRRQPMASLWGEMSALCYAINNLARIYRTHDSQTNAVNMRTKNGHARRAEAREAFEVERGNDLLQHVPTQAEIRQLRGGITELQSRQKQLIPQMRAQNAEHMAQQKWDAEIRRRRDTQALTLGQFWHASRDAIKSYFNPPFGKNYLADVSAEWRAALFLECESVSYQYGCDNNWGHKLSGTGHAYLCGIDDNGDEWGHEVTIELGYDEHYNQPLDATVEDAMSELFGVSLKKLDGCTRQGDLLFCPAEIPRATETHAQVESWEVRESHEVVSDGLERNGQYFKSHNDIRVTHTSHPTVILPPGSYRLYELQIADAD